MKKHIRTRILLVILFGVLTPLFIMGQQTISAEQQDFLFAEKLLSNGMYDLAATKFVRYAEEFPLSLRAPEALLRAGECYTQMQNFEKAYLIYRDLLLRFPNSALIDKCQFNTGECLQSLGKHKDAGIAFERVHIFTPKSELAPVALLRAGQEFLAAGELRKAKDVIFFLIEKYPTTPHRFEARYLLARIHLKSENPILALQELNKIIGEKLDDQLALKAQFLKAEIQEDMGQFNDAETGYRKVADSSVPSNIVAKAALHLAEMSLRRGEHEEVSSLVQKGLQSCNDSLLRSHLQRVQGDNLFAQGAYAEAIKVLSGIPTDSMSSYDQALLRFRLGVTYEKQNNFEQAVKEYRVVVALSDTIKTADKLEHLAVMNLVNALCANGKATDAVTLLRQQQQKPSADFRILYKLGQVRQQYLKDYSGAIRAYTMVIESHPICSLVDQAQFAIAKCLELLGEPNRAKDEYRTLLRQYPGSELAATARQRISFIDKFVSKGSAEVNRQLSAMLAQSALGDTENISALQLADLNFDVFRDYHMALRLYRKALSTGSVGGAELDKVAFKMAMSHKALAEKSQINGEFEKVHTHSDSLTKIYELLIQKSPQSKWKWVAKANRDLVEATLLNIKQLENRAALLDTLLHQLSKDTKWDSLRLFIPLQLASALFELGNRTDGESLIQRSIQLCDTVLASAAQKEAKADACYIRSQGMIFLNKKSEAERDLENFISKYPLDDRIAKATFELAKIKLALKEIEATRTLYRTLTEKYFYTDYADSTRLGLCKLLSLQGLYQEGVECLQALNTEISDELWLYAKSLNWQEYDWALGQAYARAGLTTRAELVYRTFVKSCSDCPQRAKALWELANLARERNALEIALARYLELEKEFPSDTLGLVASVKAADLLYEKEQWVKAWDKYEKARSRASGDLLQHCSQQVVMCAYKMGDFNTAEAGFKRFRNNFNDRAALAEMLYEKGSYLLKKKNFNAAEKAFKELTGKYKDIPEGARGELGLGRMYVILNKTDEALKVLTGIPAKYSDPKVVSKAYISLGDFYYQNRQLENAIFAFKKVLDLKVEGSERASALRYLIRCYDDVHLWDRAVALAREYAELYPEADDVFAKKVQIGVFMLNLKEYERGIAYLADLKRQADRETEAEIQYWIGKAYLDMGRFEEAIAELLKVKYLCPPTELPWAITAVYESGRAYQRLGKLEEAKKLFEQVVREEGAESRFGRVARERIQEIDKELAGGSS